MGMKPNDIVKYSRPQEGEEDLRFGLIEVNGNRVLIQLICDYTIKPTETVLLTDVIKADE